MPTDSALEQLRHTGARARTAERTLRQAAQRAGEEETVVIAGVLRDAFAEFSDLRLLQLWERYDAPIGVRIAASQPTAQRIRHALQHLSSFGLARFAHSAGGDVHHRAWVVASRSGVQIAHLPDGVAPPADLRRHPQMPVTFTGAGVHTHLHALMTVRQHVADASGQWESARAAWSEQTRTHTALALPALRQRHPWAVALRILDDDWLALVGPGACAAETLTPGFHPLSGDGWSAEIDGIELVDLLDVPTLRALHRTTLIPL